MTYIYDIDDTIIKSDLINGEYCNAEPIQSEIDILNKLYDAGSKIMLHTGRHWNHYDITIEQLKQFGVKYHGLIMGKIPGIYIDKDALNTGKGLI
jgi:hydroxymethylpyrimidine pyrophosphatase-like HAD family hydrolase